MDTRTSESLLLRHFCTLAKQLTVNMIILAAWNIVRLLLWLKAWKMLCFLVLPKCLNCVFVCCSYVFYGTPIVVLLSLFIFFFFELFFSMNDIKPLCSWNCLFFRYQHMGQIWNLCVQESDWPLQLSFTIPFCNSFPPPLPPKKKWLCIANGSAWS